MHMAPTRSIVYPQKEKNEKIPNTDALISTDDALSH